MLVQCVRQREREVIKVDETLVHLTILFRSLIFVHKLEKVKMLTVANSLHNNVFDCIAVTYNIIIYDRIAVWRNQMRK